MARSSLAQCCTPVSFRNVILFRLCMCVPPSRAVWWKRQRLCLLCGEQGTIWSHCHVHASRGAGRDTKLGQDAQPRSKCNRVGSRPAVLCPRAVCGVDGGRRRHVWRQLPVECRLSGGSSQGRVRNRCFCLVREAHLCNEERPRMSVGLRRRPGVLHVCRQGASPSALFSSR